MNKGLQKVCQGKYEPMLAKERNCAGCNSLQVCIMEQQVKPIKKYIKLSEIKQEEIKYQLIEIQKKLEDKKPTVKRTVMRCLKYICTSKEITPDQITVMDLADYIQYYENNRQSIAPLISAIKMTARDILKLKKWEWIGTYGKTKDKIRTKTDYNNPELTETKLWQDFQKHHTTYVKLRRIKNKSPAYTYQRKFIYFCWKKGIKNFEFEELKKYIITFLEETNVEDTSYALIWEALKLLFESAFNYTEFKYKIIKPAQAKPKLKKLPKEEETKAIFNYFKIDKDIRWYPLFACIAYSSVRIEKITELDWDITDLDYNYFRLENTKTGDRDKVIAGELVDILNEYKEIHKKAYPNTNLLFPDGNKLKPMDPRKARKKLEDVSKLLKIPYYPPNHYRALIGINIWIDSEYNWSKAQAFFDHDSVETTKRYIRHFRSLEHKVDFGKHMPNYTSKRKNSQEKRSKDLEKFYSNLVKKFHPDMNKDGENIFRQIQEIYEEM